MLIIVILRLIVLPPYEERLTRYLAYITVDKVRRSKIPHKIVGTAIFLRVY